MSERAAKKFCDSYYAPILVLFAFGILGGFIGGTLMYELRGRAQAEGIIADVIQDRVERLSYENATLKAENERLRTHTP